jgi:hypothetical protein
MLSENNLMVAQSCHIVGVEVEFPNQPNQEEEEEEEAGIELQMSKIMGANFQFVRI